MGSEKNKKKPWPTKEAMEQIYDKNLWGKHEDSIFYSGYGSHNSEIIEPYKEVVILFLKSFKEPIKICDLGCGDFNIGKHLVEYSKQYIAIDIVSKLISYNKKNFKQNNLDFYCLNIAKDDLPVGDCAIVRQVLQHLSNTEVNSVLNKLRSFKYIILTEHIPKEEFIANQDIISGQGIRIKKGSGLNVLTPPFNFQVKEKKILNSIILENNKGIIETILYTVF